MTSLKDQQKLLKDAGKGVLEWGKSEGKKIGKAAKTVKNLVEGIVTGDKIKINRTVSNYNKQSKAELAATEDNKSGPIKNKNK